MGVRRCTVCDAPLPGSMQSSTHADPAFCQRINAGRELMGRSSNWRWWAPRHLAALLNLWEPTIRADEREQVALDTAAGIVDSGLRAVIVDEALADLRAKVKALPVAVVDLDPDPHGRPIERRAVLLSDVLALLEEKS